MGFNMSQVAELSQADDKLSRLKACFIASLSGNQVRADCFVFNSVLYFCSFDKGETSLLQAKIKLHRPVILYLRNNNNLMKHVLL
jgi:hypothetical protein